MSLPELLTVKFSLYTLACRELLNRLGGLLRATQADTRLDYQNCLKRFDEVLNRFFERSSVSESLRAAEVFGNLLRAECDLFRDINEHVATIFDEVVAAILENVSSWHHQTDLEQLHAQGQKLACHFFANSPWEETKQRIGRECQLVVRYETQASDDPIHLPAEPFGYPLAPMACYLKYWDEDQGEYRPDVVLVRFNLSYDFNLYLAYPFLFLHEYTAHFYATDYGNERFNDGWMLHAAAAFLKREYTFASEELKLSLDQADVFYELLYDKLNPIPRRACKFARRFDDWVSAELPGRFMQITYELAAFQPGAGLKEHWPNQFINALENEFRRDRKRLLSKIRNSDNTRELMTTLSSV